MKKLLSIVFIFLITIFSSSYFLFPETFFKTIAHIEPTIYSLFYFTPKEDRIFLDIDHKNFQKLVYYREIALQKGRIPEKSKKFISAKLRFRGKIYKINLRLKGDLLDHVIDKQWSFRVKVKNQESILGLKSFSLQHPKRRGGLIEWVWHKALKKEGLITPKYEFFELIVNGKSWGIYNLEEHFEKQIIERNKFREGPIIKLDESFFFNSEKLFSVEQIIQHSLITSFNKKNHLSKPLQQSFIQASQKIQAFIHNQLTVDQVFDIDKLAKAMALIKIMGAGHSIAFNNIRFYYNPITTLLEPVCFDGNCKPQLDPPLYEIDKMPFSKKLLKNEKLKTTYFKKIKSFTEKKYLDVFLQKIETEFQLNQNKLRTIYPKKEIDLILIYSNAKKIREELSNEN